MVSTGNHLKRLVLASQSPRRLELLRMAGWEPVVRPPHIREELEIGESPEDYVQRLARSKASATPAAVDEVVLAADTVVVLRDGGRTRILEKPRSATDAREMLSALSGKVHEVMTGVAIVSGNEMRVHVETTLVSFAILSAREIDRYVETQEPMDKAGAYAVQGLASKFVARIEGCYFNVVGLPVAWVYQQLKDMGLELRA